MAGSMTALRWLFYLDMIRFAIEHVSAASGLEKRW
jgi:hypothetical protein